MEKVQDKTIAIVAILCIATLEGIALESGVDGTVFSLAISAIAGIAGYVIPSPIQNKPTKKP